MTTTFAQLAADLEAEAKSVLANIETGLSTIEANIVPIIEQDVATVLGQFKTLAVQTVLQMAQGVNAALSGQEKLGTVITTVIQAAEAAGLQIALEDATMFSQQAYNAVAAFFGGSASAATS